MHAFSRDQSKQSSSLTYQAEDSFLGRLSGLYLPPECG